MKRLLCFLMVLSAITLFIFYQVAALFPDSADVVMGRLCVICGLAAFATSWFTGKHLMAWSAACLSVAFFVGIHPNLPLNSWAVFVGVGAVAAGFFVAIAIDHIYKDGKDTYVGDGVFSRIVLSATFGLGGAIVAQHLAYRAPAGETLPFVIVIDAALLLVALRVAPWRPEDRAAVSPRALWKRFGKRTAN